MTESSTTPRITSQPHEINWWAAVDHMLGDYLTDRGNKIPIEFPAIIKKIIKEDSKGLKAPTNCDPFYNADVDRKRFENYGAYDKEDRQKVIAFVEYGTNREIEDIIISPVATKDYESLSSWEPGNVDDKYSYLFLPRVDVTELHKKKPTEIVEGREINIGYRNPKNPNPKDLVAKNTEVKKKEIQIPGNFKIVRPSGN
jgi:hypothetical protein